MRIDHTGHVGLGAADHHAVVSLFNHVHKEIRSFLLAGPQAAVAFDVGHGSGDHQVVVLHVDEELLKAFVVIRTVFLVDLVRDGIGRVHRIESHAALVAGAGLLGDRTQHFDLRQQVVDALVDMRKAVDLMPGDMGRGGAQILVILAVRKRIGHGCRCHVTLYERMIDQGLRVLQLAFDVDAHVPLSQAVFVLLCCFHMCFLL